MTAGFIAVGAEGAFAEDEFEYGLESWDAGGDDDDVRFDTAQLVWLDRVRLTYLVHMMRSAVPSSQVSENMMQDTTQLTGIVRLVCQAFELRAFDNSQGRDTAGQYFHCLN